MGLIAGHAYTLLNCMQTPMDCAARASQGTRAQAKLKQLELMIRGDQRDVMKIDREAFVRGMRSRDDSHELETKVETEGDGPHTLRINERENGEEAHRGREKKDQERTTESATSNLQLRASDQSDGAHS